MSYFCRFCLIELLFQVPRPDQSGDHPPYRAKISKENQGTLGMGAGGQDRLAESSGSLNDV